MLKIGLIAEYNPLHNGHKYHFDKIKELYKDSMIITILSSEFSQRGNLCVFNKFMRTKHSLLLGSDLVLSNPIYYSMNSASTFAYSNVFFLNKCNVDIIVAGSESMNVIQLEEIFKLENSLNFQNKLKELLSLGYSFKLAYTKSLDYFNISIKSNDLLNYFYYKAINEINPNIKLVLIKRINNDYRDELTNSSNIQSATSIRKLNDISKYVPKFVNDDYLNYKFRDINKLNDLIKYSFINRNNNVREDTEGLSNRFENISFNNYYDLLDNIKTKRYSESKLNRYIISNLLNIKSDKIKYDNYIRVLGFNENGKNLLNEIKKDVIIYTNIKEGINEAFDLEIKADKILDIIYNENLVLKDLRGPIKM
jgi:predicted nucleotidyltransferase